jgi:hypothetical protein
MVGTPFFFEQFWYSNPRQAKDSWSGEGHSPLILIQPYKYPPRSKFSTFLGSNVPHLGFAQVVV